MSRRRGRCWYCGHELVGTMPLRDRSKTRDHVVPKSRGGTITVRACSLCNRRKVKPDGGLFYGESGFEQWAT